MTVGAVSISHIKEKNVLGGTTHTLNIIQFSWPLRKQVGYQGTISF